MNYDLSKPQEAIYYMSKFAEDSIANIAGDIFFNFNVSIDDVKEAIIDFLNKCDVMHTRIIYVDSKPMQCVYRDYNYNDIPILKFTNDEEYTRWAQNDAQTPIAITGCLYRIFLIDINGKIGLYSVTHHIISDATSFAFIGKYVTRYLKGERNITIYPYYEYLQLEKSYEQTKRYEKDRLFWMEEFQKIEVNYYSTKETRCMKASRYSFILSKNICDIIKSFCGINDISVYSLLFSVLAINYFKKTQREQFFIGTPILNRFSNREENMLGVFVNTVPVGFSIRGDDTFNSFCDKTNDKILYSFRHQKYPYTQLLKDIYLSNHSEIKMFDILFSFWNVKTHDESNANWYSCCSQIESLQIHVDDRKSNGEYLINYDYQTEKFTEEEIEGFHRHFCNLLYDALENPDKKISDLEMLLPEEKHKILYGFNNTAAAYAKDKCVHELFEEQAEKTPEKTAVVASDKTLTYKELNEEANRIAHSLAKKGIGKGGIVGIKLPRKSNLLSALFGVLKTGAAYLPIDSEYPDERIEYMLTDSGAAFCITEENISELVDNENTENPENTVGGEDICYCIYTSGSTGKAKGTLIYHRNLVWYMSVLKSIYGTDNINMPVFTSPGVDLTITSLYFPLINGGCNYLYSDDLKANLVDIFNNPNVTMLKLTPTHMRIICKIVSPKKCNNIRYLIVGGENLNTECCSEFLKKYGSHIEVHNEYGPTETTVGCTDFVYKSGERNVDLIVPIGCPVNNVQIYVVDKYLNPVPIGVTGELCIAGDGVGAGYLNNTELTAEKFVDNPFGAGKLYRTGDLAYWREDGNIVYVGRGDFQVKINGQRIELGEIENAVQSVDGVVQCAAIVKKDEENRLLICAFYTGKEFNANEIRATLLSKLPRYMVPHAFLHLENLPISISGKIDRNILDEIDLSSVLEKAEFIGPKTEKEIALANAMRSILRIDNINMYDNFFSIGGDSISAIYIASELEELGYELHVVDILQKDSLSDVAKTMEAISCKMTYNQDEVNGFIPFSPIMRAYLNESSMILNDFVYTCILSLDCDEDCARKAIDAILSHHDILRGSLCADGIVVQPSNSVKSYSFKSVSITDYEKAIETLNNLRIDDNKLFNVVFCNTEKENLISITIHHFLIDLVSLEVILKDFQIAIKQLKNNDSVFLPAKTASFKLWGEELQKYAETISDESKEYWNNINNKLNDTKSFCFDCEIENDAEFYTIELDEQLSNKLFFDVNRKYGTRTNEVLLTALGMAAGRMASGSVGIIVESHGRAELHKPIAVEHTVGWFTSCYPVIVKNNYDLTEEIIEIKESLRRIPKYGIDYLILSQGFHKNTEIVFNFYNKNNVDNENKVKAYNFDTAVFPNKLNVSCTVIDNILTISASVLKGKHDRQICEKLGKAFVEEIKNIVNLSTLSDAIIKTRSDFSDDKLSEIELDELKDLFDRTDDNE